MRAVIVVPIYIYIYVFIVYLCVCIYKKGGAPKRFIISSAAAADAEFKRGENRE